VTAPLPNTPDGIPIEEFQLTGAHGAVWTWCYVTDPPGVDSYLRWRSPGRVDWYGTTDELNEAHGPLTWNHAAYPVEDRTIPVYGADGQMWVYVSQRWGWVKNPCPPEESDDAMTWNWLVKIYDVTPSDPVTGF
jgi:hypothetical protein